MKNLAFLFLICLVSSAGASLKPVQKTPLVVYTSRKAPLLKPLVDAYEKVSGVKVTLVNGKAGIFVERLKREGSNSPADVLVTVDAGNLWHAAEKDLLLPLHSKVLSRIPQQFRDERNRWFGLSLRARTIFYNKDKVKPSELSTYEDLANPKWKGKLCLRTSRKVYNQSLVGIMIHHLGDKKARTTVKKWVENLAKPVFTSDSLLLKAINKGQCQVGIANTYYLARLQADGKASKVAAYWPNQTTTGVHVNISGAGVVRYSKHQKEAQKFIEWLATTGQKLFADSNHEYPVQKRVKPSKAIASWGKFKKDQTPLNMAGKMQKQAIELMDSVGYR